MSQLQETEQKRPTTRERGPGRRTRPAWNRSSTAWLSVGVVVLVGLFMAGFAAHGFDRADEDGVTSAAPGKLGNKPAATRAPRQPAFGDPVRDGKFEFVVARMDCGKSTVTNGYLKTTARGKFCVVSLSARNVGDQSRIFSGRAQKAFDAAGAEFSNDSLADFYANDNSQTFLKRIVPGAKVTGKVVFDVPRSTTPTVIELHDSFLSDGIRVNLKKH